MRPMSPTGPPTPARIGLRIKMGNAVAQNWHRTFLVKVVQFNGLVEKV